MTNTIAQMWYGNIDPAQTFGMNDPEMRRLESLLSKNQDKLEQSIGEKDKELLEKYIDCVYEYVCTNCRQAFCSGYCMGAKLTAEALIGAEQITANS